MTHPEDIDSSAFQLNDHVQNALKSWPRADDAIGIARCPAVVDVMGGIVEDSGALLLTSTLGAAIHVAAWHTRDTGLHIRRVRTGGSAASFESPIEAVAGEKASTATILAQCRQNNADWAAPVCLALNQAVSSHALPRHSRGLAILVLDEFPANADFGHRSVTAAATVYALAKLAGIDVDRLTLAKVAAEAVSQETGVYAVRKTLTALAAPPTASLLQLRFRPHLLCEALDLPAGIVLTGLTTQLGRPTGLERLRETRVCAEMGDKLISQLKKQDGEATDGQLHQLSSVTSTEYVDRFRNRLPSKITYRDYSAKFGEIRGLDGTGDKSIYKIRSRVEHHIYENGRVGEFASSLMRARRNNTPGELIRAGELMYCSHWSHSQRCGIGGKEADVLQTCLRAEGPDQGIYGVKVTGGGNGGELVVLMRDDDTAHAALTRAVAKAEKATGQTIHIHTGSLPGAESFDAPQLIGAVDTAGAV